MKSLRFGSSAFCACVVAALLAGCGTAQPPTAASVTALRRLGTSSYQVLYRFGSRHNPRHDIGGAGPEGLVAVGGELYGTTAGGGYRNWGTVYSVSTAGAKTVLHRFDYKTNDGLNPVGTLIAVNGLLYGATYIGGKCGSGSIYSISTSGTEKLLHSLCGSDGIQPLAGLVNVNGTLYGTTVYGGAHNYGTVYTIDATGKEKVLYSFQSGSDGALPFSALIDVNGTLYGTTSQGGGNHVGCSPSYAGCGTAYSIGTTGDEKVLYAFGGFGSGGGANGASPTAGLLELNGALYGAASSGGSDGLGVVFSLSPSGSEQDLHNFAGGSDGANPARELIDLNGTLYGTTPQGGSTSGCTKYGRSGCGTIFSFSPY